MTFLKSAILKDNLFLRDNLGNTFFYKYWSIQYNHP